MSSARTVAPLPDLVKAAAHHLDALLPGVCARTALLRVTRSYKAQAGTVSVGLVIDPQVDNLEHHERRALGELLGLLQHVGFHAVAAGRDAAGNPSIKLTGYYGSTIPEPVTAVAQVIDLAAERIRRAS